MSRDDGGYWLPIHTGLLRDARWAMLGPDARGAWVTLFLLLDGEPAVGWFKDRDRAVWLLDHEWRMGNGADLIQELELADVLIPEEGTDRVTLRGWDKYTGATARKAVYNRTRGDRGDRSEEYARRNGRQRETTGATGRPRRDKTPPSGRLVSPPTGAAEDKPDPSKAEAKSIVGSLRDRVKEVGGKWVVADPQHVLTDEAG